MSDEALEEFPVVDGPDFIERRRAPGWFCPDCGLALVSSVRGGEPYARCFGCGYVRYRNPVVGVAVVVRDAAGRVLMGRRATGEYAGRWCIPCGYVEWGEEVRSAARREFREETGLEAEVRDVVAVHSNFHNPKLYTVGIWFAGTISGGVLHPVDGEFDTLAYFDCGAPPALAFPTDGLVLAQLATTT